MREDFSFVYLSIIFLCLLNEHLKSIFVEFIGAFLLKVLACFDYFFQLVVIDVLAKRLCHLPQVSKIDLSILVEVKHFKSLVDGLVVLVCLAHLLLHDLQEFPFS